MTTPLPAKNIFDGTVVPTPPTSLMKATLGNLRDYLAGLLGTTGAASDAVTALGLSSQPTMRNKVIGHFDINQRGFTSVADDTYCCDRWYVLTESGNVTVGQVSDPESGAPWAWKLTQPDATAKRMGLATIIESKDIRAFRNAAMNFYMRVKPSFSGNVRYAIIEHTGTADTVTSDVVSNWSSTSFTAGGFFIAGLNIIKTGVIAPGAATYGEFSDYGVMGASLNNAILFVWTESAQAQNATLEMNRPQFELGTIHTPHEWRINELALCQRYCEFVTSTGVEFNGYTTSGYNGYANYFFKVTKRDVPTISNVTNVNNSSFPTSGGITGFLHGAYEYRTANATSQTGYFGSSFLASAEL